MILDYICLPQGDHHHTTEGGGGDCLQTKRCCIENQTNLEKSKGMGSIWLDMGSYLVRMKRTGSRKLSKCLPDLWDTIKIKKI